MAFAVDERVRLLAKGRERLLLPADDWTGTVQEVRASDEESPTQYRVKFDDRLKEDDAYVHESEIEKL